MLRGVSAILPFALLNAVGKVFGDHHEREVSHPFENRLNENAVWNASVVDRVHKQLCSSLFSSSEPYFFQLISPCTVLWFSLWPVKRKKEPPFFSYAQILCREAPFSEICKCWSCAPFCHVVGHQKIPGGSMLGFISCLILMRPAYDTREHRSRMLIALCFQLCFSLVCMRVASSVMQNMEDVGGTLECSLQSSLQWESV